MKVKKHLLLAGVLLLSAVTLPACASSSEPASSTLQNSPSSAVESSVSSGTSDTDTADEKVYTQEELAQFNGKDGQPAYVAVDGVVYDVTDVPQWANGEHKNGLIAGQDLTEEIKNQSPHGVSILDNLPVVGVLE